MNLINLLSTDAAITVTNQGWNAERLNILLFQYINTLDGHTPEGLENFLEDAAVEENEE